MNATAWAGWVIVLALAPVGWAVQRSLAARSEAVIRACHELRGPLAAARLGLELGTRGHPLTPAQLRAIDTELGRATLALDDLARARQAATQDGGLVDVGGLIGDSVTAWRPTAQAAGVQLTLVAAPPAVFVRAQRLRLAQVAGNLIANAIEHGGGCVRVGVAVGAGRVQVSVRDEGPGLRDSLEVLAARAARGRGFRGRGLAIARRVAAVHGGRLLAVPCARGAHLVLELPLAGPAPDSTG